MERITLTGKGDYVMNTNFMDKWLPPIAGISVGLLIFGSIYGMVYIVDITEIPPNNYQDVAKILDDDPALKDDVSKIMEDGKIVNWEFQKLIKWQSRRLVQKLLVEKQ